MASTPGGGGAIAMFLSGPVAAEPARGARRAPHELGGHGPEQLDGLRQVRLVLAEGLARPRRLRVEERLAREQLEDEAAHAPDVRRRPEGPEPQDALGAPVLARLDVARALPPDVERRAQVHELDAADGRRAREQHVLGLDVRVQHADLVVHEGQALEEARRAPLRLGHLERAAVLDLVEERAPQQLEDHAHVVPVRPRDVEVLEQLDDVRRAPRLAGAPSDVRQDLDLRDGARRVPVRESSSESGRTRRFFAKSLLRDGAASI